MGAEWDTLTPITMREPAHSVLDEEDRILDGTHTVVREIRGPLVDDEPVLNRNKTLQLIHPAAIGHWRSSSTR